MLLCPLRSTTGIKNCMKKECAWWDQYYDTERCCILTIAKNLDYVADICDGTRTLFVKNC